MIAPMRETIADRPTDPGAAVPDAGEVNAGGGPATAPTYDPERFWETRLRGRFDLTGAGFRGLGNAFNRALYRQREVVLGRAIRRFHIDPTGADVVELGPGTGFYVRLWQERRVASLVGLDITAVVPERLSSEFPQFRFAQADASRRWPVDDASSDLVTAFDILFHIVDDAGFNAALMEAGRVVRPGGHFLVSDLFIHGEAFRGFHQVSRSLGDYQAALDAAGFEVLGRLPIFVTMHPALDLPSGRRRRLAERWWTWLEQTLLDNPRRGYRLGTLLFWVDRLLTRPFRGGPSTELLVARRR
jgi:SAM-dependent methyltransferase